MKTTALGRCFRLKTAARSCVKLILSKVKHSIINPFLNQTQAEEEEGFFGGSSNRLTCSSLDIK